MRNNVDCDELEALRLLKPKIKGAKMAWSFRKSIKIAPGVRINLSKSGVSTSIGGKGVTYNTRGRLTTSIPGTGIRYTHNLKARRTASPIGSAVAASARIDSVSIDRLSKREQATRDFVTQIRDRTTEALRHYFISHGVYVHSEDLADAVTLEDHQEFLGSLTREFEATTKAIKLAVDIGSISLSEKEKAMLALYEIEGKCEDHHGDRDELEEAENSLRNKVLAWPVSPSFVGPFLVSLLGCSFLLANFTLGSIILIVGSALYGIYKLQSFEKKKASVLEEITEADAKFDSLVTSEISPRPAVPNMKDKARTKALTFAGIIVVMLALVAVVFLQSEIERTTLSASENSSQTDKNAQLGNKPTLNISASAPAKSSALHRSQADFKWLIGKYPSDVVNDRQFRAAFNNVPPVEWKKIADRLAVTDASGIQSKDGYYFGNGCKAHFCDSDNAAFAINEVTGKGAVIYKETTDQTPNKIVANGFAWSNTPIRSTPLAAWANSNGMEINTAVSGSDLASRTALQTSFDCTKARSDIERLICGDRELAADDLELAGVFSQAKAAVADQAAFKERARREWNYREQNCHERDCVVRWYADQKAALRQIAETGNIMAN